MLTLHKVYLNLGIAIILDTKSYERRSMPLDEARALLDSQDMMEFHSLHKVEELA